MASSSKVATKLSSRRSPGGSVAASEIEQIQLLHGSLSSSGSVPGLEMGTPQMLRDTWLLENNDVYRVMERCRAISEPNPWCKWSWTAKSDIFGAGFQVLDEKLWANLPTRAALQRLRDDAWREFFICSNIVAIWREEKAVGQLLPNITIFNCEDCVYSDLFGEEVLKIRVKKRALPKDSRLPAHWKEAITQGKMLTLDEKQGDRFVVLSTAKMGEGLGMPEWRSWFFDLSIWELLRTGDWNGAFARKNLLRLFKKGHEITSGDLAGRNDHFLTRKQAKAFAEKIKNLSGYAEFLSNFDFSGEYLYLKPDFFDPKVYDGVEGRLARYAGPLGMMLEPGARNADLMHLLAAEGRRAREKVGDRFLQKILQKAVGRFVEVKWDDSVFFNQKMLMAWISLGIQNGLCGPTTARNLMHFDPDRENADMIESHKNPEAHIPVFEAKQGIAAQEQDPNNEGGRPKKSEG